MHVLLRSICVCVLFVLPALALATEEALEVFNQSVENRAFILFEENEKVYLKPEAILPTDQGLFVKTGCNEYLQIPFLISSDRGCYTVLSQVDSTVYPLIRCKNCDLLFNPNFFNRGKCPRCGTQN